MRGATLATAESCTGGMLAERLTGVSGSSRSFLGGAVVYSNDLKSAFAGVPHPPHRRVRRRSRETTPKPSPKASALVPEPPSASAITGIAGPTGGTEDKPVGLVYIAIDDEKHSEVIEKRFGGDRERIRQWSTQQALDAVPPLADVVPRATTKTELSS